MSVIDYEVRQEPDDVATGSVIRIAVASVVIGAIGVLFAGVILVARIGALQPSFAGPSGPLPAPSEISHIEQTPIFTARAGIDQRDAQRRELDRWGWVDRKAGIARIPIDRAMDIVTRESP
jgi:hypothetical protein